MLRIRLRRVGKKGKPSYRIVVAEAKAPRDGAYVEWIGNYDPMVNPPAVTIKADRALEWLSKGAQPSDAVRRILDWNGILERTPKQPKGSTSTSEQTPAEAPVAVQTQPAAAAPAQDAPPAQDAVEDVAEEVVAEAASEETTGAASAEEATSEATEDASAEPPEETTGEAGEDTSVEATEDASAEAPEDTSGEAGEDSSAEATKE
jgi:small subunit ribosomal protein S16